VENAMPILLVPDVDSTSAVMAQNFGVCTAVTVWSNALLNTTIYPLDPKPTWYDPLNAQLAAAVTPARTWVETNGPAVLSQIPQGFIDFGNLFNAAAPDVESTMTAVAAATGHTPTTEQMSLLTQTVATLLQQAQSAQATAMTHQATVKAFADTIRAQHAALTETISGAESTLGGDEQQIADLQSTIDSLQNTLGIDSSTASDSAMTAYTSGLSLFGSLFVFSLTTIATGGAALPLMAIAAATVTISVNGAKNASSDSSVQSNLAALAQAQQQLSAEDAQVAALRSILTTLEKLLDCNSTLSYASDIIVPIWNDVVTRLQFVQEILTQPTVDLTLVSALTTFSTAATKWTSIITSATNVQSSTLSMSDAIDLNAQTS
jgi:hypothetical protein